MVKGDQRRQYQARIDLRLRPPSWNYLQPGRTDERVAKCLAKHFFKLTFVDQCFQVQRTTD
jgi:hypothetical protein